MNIFTLKERLCPKERKADTALEISQEDIKLIQDNTELIWKTPLAVFGVLLATKIVLKIGKIPNLLRNPLSPADKFVKRKKYWDRFMSNHVIFIGTSAALAYSVVYYELTKYYLFLKYENLVNAYQDATERDIFTRLQLLNQAYELKKLPE